jgi:hypothetical protein
MYEKYGNTSVLWICPVCDTNESPILSLIFNEISEILVNKEYEFKQRSECPEDKYDRNIVLEWFGVSHTGQIQRREFVDII